MRFLNLIFFVFLSITFYQSVLHLHVSVAAINTLNPGDKLISLNSTSYLVSDNGKFILGFFTIPPTNNFTYLGITSFLIPSDNIWGPHDIFDPHSKVWVANRDMPMTDKGVLMIDDSGSMKVVTENGTTLFTIFYNQIGKGNYNTRALLEDSGNFLVYDKTNNQTLWQSFDYPTDTLLPGMKIGYNLTTGQNWTLTSWLSNQVPATGAFTVKLEVYKNFPQLVTYMRGELFRASSPWKDQIYYNESLIFDPSGIYLTSDIAIHITPDGRLVSGFMNPIEMEFCFGHNALYANNDECGFSTTPDCRGLRDRFQLLSGDWGIGYSIHEDDNSSLGLSDCAVRCWNDCNCLGFNTSNTDGTGCSTWVKNDIINRILFHKDPFSNTPQKYVLVSQKPPIIKRWMLIVVPIAIFHISILAVYLCYVRIRRCRREAKEKKRRDDIINQLTGSNSFNYGDELEKGLKDAPDVRIFSLKAILTATHNFSNKNKLGQGGYGPVFKGKLSDGREIAVKKLSKTSGQGIGEFKNELILITKLQHTNLVRLYGCCIHQDEKMLIYQFMPNKSLDFFLFADDKKHKIDWRIRFNIIEGVAQGLLYLHKYSRMRVIHRDLKVSNILLDENMNPKIADFGLARIFQQNVTEVMTKRVVGTYGYMAPEYAMHGTFSIKSDVFSFGVLILEIISGKKNSSFHNFDMPLNLVGYAWELWKREATLELKDEALGESYDTKQLLRSIHIGLLCVQEIADNRPTMLEVMLMIHNEIVELPIPKQASFFTQPYEVQTQKSTDPLLGDNSKVSINDLTLTKMVAR